jgi:hypothetical protein
MIIIGVVLTIIGSALLVQGITPSRFGPIMFGVGIGLVLVGLFK